MDKTPVALLIYTTPETVSRKVDGDNPGVIHFWAFKRRPRRLSEVTRIYFAASGRIAAYADAREDDLPGLLSWMEYGSERDDYEGYAACVSWAETDAYRLEDRPETKPFRGFRYLERGDWPNSEEAA